MWIHYRLSTLLQERACYGTEEVHNVLLTQSLRLRFGSEANKSFLKSYNCFPWISNLFFISFIMNFLFFPYLKKERKQFSCLTETAAKFCTCPLDLPWQFPFGSSHFYI